MKNAFLSLAVAAGLSSCVSGDGSVNVGNTINNIGVPVRSSVSSLPPAPYIPITEDEYVDLLKARARDNWEREEREYNEKKEYKSGW